MSRSCRLETLMGRQQRCGEGGCPFWEPGGAALAGRCMFEQIDFIGRLDVALELLRLREALDASASGEEKLRARQEYHRRLNEAGEE